MAAIFNKATAPPAIDAAGTKTTGDLMSSGVSTALFVVVGLLACLSVAPALVALVEQWSSVVDYDYCFVIAAVCAGWLWRSIRTIPGTQLHPDWRLLAALAMASGAEYILWQGHSELGAQLLLPPILWLSFASVTGWRVAKRLLAPVAYFYFAIPIWDQLLPMLQQITLFGAKLGMQLAAVPVTVSGNKVTIAEGTFEVIYGCSGLRYLIVALALAALMAVLERMPLRRLIIFLAIAAALAIVANWLRVFIVMYAGHVTGMRHYFVTDSHTGVGHAVFAGLLALIYWLAGRMANGNKPASVSAPREMNAHLPAAGVRTQMMIVQITIVAVLLLTFAGLNARANWAVQQAVMPTLQPLPVLVGEWQGPLPSASRWQPTFDGASDARRASYISKHSQVDVYLNVYGSQQQGKELIFYRNTVYAPGAWQLVEANVGNAMKASIGSGLLVTEQLTAEGERWLIGRTYVIGGSRTATGLFAQLLYGLSTATRPAPAGVLALAVRCSADCAAAHQSLDDFWNQAGDALAASIPKLLPES